MTERTVCLPHSTNYTLSIQDCFGDGLCCSMGQGYYEVYDPEGTQILEGGEFTTVSSGTISVPSLVPASSSASPSVSPSSANRSTSPSTTPSVNLSAEPSVLLSTTPSTRSSRIIIVATTSPISASSSHSVSPSSASITSRHFLRRDDLNSNSDIMKMNHCVCVNNIKFRHKGKNKKDCLWFSRKKKKSRRKKLCQKYWRNIIPTITRLMIRGDDTNKDEKNRMISFYCPGVCVSTRL